MSRRLRGRVGGDNPTTSQTTPITSPDQPGLPDFSCETLKNMGRPGYEAILQLVTNKLHGPVSERSVSFSVKNKIIHFQ